MRRLLTHPLVILLIGALLSGLLIPSISRRWQDRQKELELKTGLVTEIIELITEILMFRQYFHAAVIRYQQIRHDKDKELVARHKQDAVIQGEKLDNAHIKWEVKSAVIEAKLGVYFPETGIANRWDRFARAISILIQLAELPEGEKAYSWNAFWMALPVQLNEEDFKVENARLKWHVQRKAILLNQAVIIDRILAARVRPIRPPTFLGKLLDRWRKWRSRRSTSAA